MFLILDKKMLNPTVAQIIVDAPLIARKAEAGQFIILRAKADSERLPLTIAAYDRKSGAITLIFQI
ncbi:MAG: sulfide/dihydroorotate dehydrogenase-like FAD/NAD-binding protein, partial [Bacillota bacterium]